MNGMGQKCSSGTSSPPVHRGTNMGVTSETDTLTRLSYTVGDAKKGDCRLHWKDNGGDMFTLTMRAEDRVNGTEYTHSFHKPIPGLIKRKLKETSRSKNGTKVMFEMKHPKGVDLKQYCQIE